jgi:hypothetical protein
MGEHRCAVIQLLVDRNWAYQTEIKHKLGVRKGTCTKILGDDGERAIYDLLEKKKLVSRGEYIPRLRGKGTRGNIFRLKRKVDTVEQIYMRFPKQWVSLPGSRYIRDVSSDIISRFLLKIESEDHNYPSITDADKIELAISLTAPMSDLRTVDKKTVFYQHPLGILDFIFQNKIPPPDILFENLKTWSDFFQFVQEIFFEQDRVIKGKRRIFFRPGTVTYEYPLLAYYELGWVSSVIDYARSSKIDLPYTDFLNRGIDIKDIFIRAIIEHKDHIDFLKNASEEIKKLNEMGDLLELSEDTIRCLEILKIFFERNDFDIDELIEDQIKQVTKRGIERYYQIEIKEEGYREIKEFEKYLKKLSSKSL